MFDDIQQEAYAADIRVVQLLNPGSDGGRDEARWICARAGLGWFHLSLMTCSHSCFVHVERRFAQRINQVAVVRYCSINTPTPGIVFSWIPTIHSYKHKIAARKSSLILEELVRQEFWPSVRVCGVRLLGFCKSLCDKSYTVLILAVRRRGRPRKSNCLNICKDDL